jgi:hypothetical protein
MHGAYTLAKPIVAVLVGATRTTTLPSGASVEVPHNSQTAMVQVRWQQRSFMVHLRSARCLPSRGCGRDRVPG